MHTMMLRHYNSCQTYDGAGNRVVKRFYKPATTLKHTTWYARDAQACPERRRRGNILSIYERPSPTSEVKQTEVHIYGSSRIGIEQRNITYSTSPFAWLESEQHRHAGTKRYELTDHLGNVRVTISDLLVPRPASSFGYVTQDAEVIDRRDYYPFGMEMPGRRWRAATEGAGRFGFNGKENDDEVKGEGNQQDYGFRIYDPRVARFLSVDPLDSKYPNLSPYAYSANDPVLYVDGDGRDFGVYVNHSSKTIVIKQTIHTVAGSDAANAELGASKWNAQSGRWQYAVKSGKQTIVYDVEFEITVKQHEDEKSRDAAFSGDASGEGNLFRAFSIEETEKKPGRYGIVDFATTAAGTGRNYAKVQDNQTAEDRRTFAHEIGHTLGLYHFPDGLMEDGGTRGQGDVNNFVTLGNVSTVLSRVGIGSSAVDSNWQARIYRQGPEPRGFLNGAVRSDPDLIGPRFPDGGF